MKKNVAFWALGLVLGSAGLAGCADDKKEGDLNGTVGSLYNDGMDALGHKKYADAVHNFEELQRQYPYSGWATKSELMEAYANLKADKPEETIVAADHFIKMHPGHKDLAYAYYLKGLAHYNRLSDVNRDQGHTREAQAAFEEVVNRFPDSIYAADAKLKLSLTRDHLAGKEMAVARYYQNQGLQLAALNRYATVVKEYQTTSQVPEALYRLTEVNLALGLNDEAKRNAAVLGYNYPASPWYAKAYGLLEGKGLAPLGQSKGWAGQIWQGIKKAF